MVSSFFCGRSRQNLAVNAWNRAKTTKIKSDVLETPVILMPKNLKKGEVKKGEMVGE